MRGRERRSGGPNSADLLVCFPARAPLTLMPKAICSPVRGSNPNKRHNHHIRSNQLKRTRTRGGGQGSPLLWAKTKSSMGPEMEEPSSPKVTCAGQIRVRPSKSWQSVMEEIERIHKKGKHKKKPSWMEALGFKKEVMQFLTCLRSLRLDFRCFGSLPAGSDVTSDEDEEEEGEEEDQENLNHHAEGGEDEESSRTVFSKWFMVLQENQSTRCCAEEEEKGKEKNEEEACVPPPNALLLMRCRSAPAKSWLEEKEEEEEQNNKHEQQEDDEEDDEEEEQHEEEEEEEEDKENNKENLVLMRYDTEFYKISSEIAKETWVVGGMRDVLSRSRSWKR